MAHRYGEPIEVAALTWPQAFRWRGRSYEVVRVLRRWRERGAWWAGPRASDERLECWRVEARDGEAGPGVFDLARDLQSGAWRLERTWD